MTSQKVNKTTYPGCTLPFATHVPMLDCPSGPPFWLAHYSPGSSPLSCLQIYFKCPSPNSLSYSLWATFMHSTERAASVRTSDLTQDTWNSLHSIRPPRNSWIFWHNSSRPLRKLYHVSGRGKFESSQCPRNSKVIRVLTPELVSLCCPSLAIILSIGFNRSGIP